MRYARSIAELVGNTPLVRLNRVTEGIAATVLAKVECLNPGGSAKDRIAARIVDAAERDGLLRPGGTIVEPTSGNTGVGLALVAQQRGYRTVFVVPDKVSEDKRAVLRAYGAEVVVTPTDVAPEDPRSYYSVSDRIVAETPGAYKPPSHPGHDIAARQMSGFGGMVSLALEDAAAARRFAEGTRLFQLAESLGGVESLVNYPDAMTHASVRGTALAVPPEVVRLSVGIEDVDDLLQDLDDALR